jgi:hypothetical protein
MRRAPYTTHYVRYSISGMSLPVVVAYMLECIGRASHSMRRTGTSQPRRAWPAPSSEGVHMRRTQWLACDDPGCRTSNGWSWAFSPYVATLGASTLL